MRPDLGRLYVDRGDQEIHPETRSMITTSLWRGIGLAILGTVACAGLAPADDRPADKILAEINAIEMPKASANRREALEKLEQRAALIGELYRSAPDHDELVKLLPERWEVRMMAPGKGAEAASAEIARVIATSKNSKLVNEAAFFQVVSVFRKAGRNPDPEKIGAAVEGFIKRFPKDDRAAMMLSVLSNMTEDQAKKDAITRRMEKDYPNSPAVKAAAKAAAAEKRQKEAIGKPFEIAFVDAIKGGEVSSKTLMGKVVVVDFWATWCGPCVAEMPKMKELYAKYKDKGVEFVGVSLDMPKEKGGYDSLKEFVEKNKIEWPQYYQGNFWESEFSSSWNVQSIPCVFLVDASGNLASVDAGGRLESMIPDYLEQAKKAAKP